MSRYALALMAVVLCGCVPYPLQTTPQVTGRVADATTKQPVAGARIQYEKYPELDATTDADGRFDFASTSKWRMVPLGPLDRPDPNVRIEAPGYQPAVSHVPIYPRKEPYVLDVQLTPSR